MKERVDILLVKRGLIETREKAKRAIMAGLVYSNETRIDKPGDKIDVRSPLTVKGDVIPYVSRGGLKLEKALKEFQVDVKDKILLDIGASTGGFTDCALQNGAKLSYAVDVGYNQLAWKLRQDERVIVMERTNFRYATREQFSKGLPNFATIDVSFISLKLILPVLKTIFIPGSDCIALIKPQFEAGREEVGKKGIVRDPKIHEKVINNIIDFATDIGYDVQNLSFSPITGGDGNIEFLLHLYWDGKKEKGFIHIPLQVSDIVKDAHEQLANKSNKDKKVE